MLHYPVLAGDTAGDAAGDKAGDKAGDGAGDGAGEVVGTVMAGYDGHRGWLYSVAVSPVHRKLGIGRQLVAHAEQALVGLGCRKINLQLLQSNAAVAAFYASMGYVVEPRISMGKLVRENISVPRPAGV